jgi:hypothetical protein
MGVTEMKRALEILSASDLADIGQPVAGELVADVEDHLRIHFPPSYREFVKKVGYCAIGSREIYGITKSGLSAASVPSVVFATRSERETGGLPAGLLLIEDSGGDEMFVIDTRVTKEDGEAPVKVWMPAFHDALELPEVGRDFGTYLLAAVERASA